MTAIPAQVAGVGRIVVCSPPRPGGGVAAGVAAACGLLYDYSNVIRYSSNIVSMAPGARNVQFVSNNIQLSSFPKYLLIFVSRSNRSPFYTDAVCPLAGGANSLTPNLTATFNNNSNFLNTFTNFNLYNLSRKAGMTQSFAQFSQFMGSVIAINFQDGSVPMELLDAVSVSKNINLQLTMNVDNYFTDSTPVNAQLNIVAFYGGAFNIIDGFSSTQNALLTPSDVANAKDSDTVSSFVESNSLIGGSFISNAVGAISGFANKLVPAQFKPAVQVAKSVYCNPEVRKGLCGEGLFYPGDYAFHGVGGAMSGGASSGGCGEGCMLRSPNSRRRWRGVADARRSDQHRARPKSPRRPTICRGAPSSRRQTLEEAAATLEGSHHDGASQAAEAPGIARQARSPSADAGRRRQGRRGHSPGGRAMGAIEGSSGQIAQIICIIDEVAFQTNLLALNAGRRGRSRRRRRPRFRRGRLGSTGPGPAVGEARKGDQGVDLELRPAQVQPGRRTWSLRPAKSLQANR